MAGFNFPVNSPGQNGYIYINLLADLNKPPVNLPNPEANTSLADPSMLPAFSDNGHADLWLSDSDLTAVQKLRPAKINSFKFVGIFLLWYIALGVCEPVGLIMACWLFAAFTIPVFLSCAAIGSMNEGNVNAALRVCAVASKSEKFLGPVGALFCRILLDQIRAVALSMNGQLVESQIILAQRLDANRDVLSEPAIQTTFGSIYANTGNLDKAEEIYTKRYNTAQSRFTEPLSKGIASSNMGWIHLLQGNNELSLQYSKEALALIDKHYHTVLGLSLAPSDWEWLKSNSLTNAARACIRLGRYDEAEKMLEDSERLIQRLTKNCGALSEAQLGFAELRLQQGRIQEAHLYAQSAIDCFRGNVGPAFYSFVYAKKVLARILQLMDRQTESEALLLETEIEEHQVIEDNENLLMRLRSKVLPNNLLNSA